MALSFHYISYTGTWVKFKNMENNWDENCFFGSTRIHSPVTLGYPWRCSVLELRQCINFSSFRGVGKNSWQTSGCVT